MPSDPSPKCLCCKELFVPDCRHRRGQAYCSKPVCKRASRAASQQRWLAKPEQKAWWQGEWNVQRVRDWRAQHPGYWRRHKRTKPVALQDTMKPAQVTEAAQDKKKPDCDCATRSVTRYVPELLKEQSPVVVGLIAQMYGDREGIALQDTIAEVAARLFERGRAVIGL